MQVPEHDDYAHDNRDSIFASEKSSVKEQKTGDKDDSNNSWFATLRPGEENVTLEECFRTKVKMLKSHTMQKWRRIARNLKCYRLFKSSFFDIKECRRRLGRQSWQTASYNDKN